MKRMIFCCLSMLLVFGACATESDGDECPTGQDRCGTQCVNTNTDNDNCGGCGNVCATGSTCVSGTCEESDCTAEICDGEDNDCDTVVDNGLTEDCSNPCGSGTRECVGGTWGDCSAPEETTEVCDGEDNDCDGAIDEGVTARFYRDSDTDTYGDPGNYQDACEAPSGFVANSDDCNDADGDVHPGATEECNGKDDNCDDTPDEGCTCTADETQDCGDWGEEGECDLGSQTCLTGGTWGECTGGVKPTEEECDTKDNDCDGDIDDGLPSDAYEDNNTCEVSRDLETAPESTFGEDPPLELADATLYMTDGSDDSDWYRINTDEGYHFCVPLTDQCCFYYTIWFTPPEGATPGDYKMCLYNEGADGEACTDFENEWCTTSDHWVEEVGAYAMTICWHGTCGAESGLEFYVEIKGSNEGVFSCSPYNLKYQFYMSDEACAGDE